MGHSCGGDNGCDGIVALKGMKAVILAGGRSSRMGEDKALMAFGQNKSLARHVSDKLLGIFGEVFIASKDDKFNDLDKSVKVLLDDSSEYSPMLALAGVLERFSEPVFIQPVDMPFLSVNGIKDMSKFKDDFEIAIAAEGERDHCLCGFFSPVVASRARELAACGEHSISKLLKASDTIRVELAGENEGLNLNTPDDMLKAKNGA